MKDHRWFCMAGIWRDAHVGEAFSLLTMDAGPDIAPYHHRQIIPLPRDQWAAWLDPRVPAADVLKWLPEGSLEVTQVYGKPPAQGALAL
jgi:putative SOS response-associated peptidase YedK